MPGYVKDHLITEENRMTAWVSQQVEQYPNAIPEDLRDTWEIRFNSQQRKEYGNKAIEASIDPLRLGAPPYKEHMPENKLDYLRNLDDRSLEGLKESNESMGRILEADSRLYNKNHEKQEHYITMVTQVLQQREAISEEIDKRQGFGISR